MTFKAACLQLCSSTKVDENIATVSSMAREAASLGAVYIQTPEMTNIVERDRACLQSVLSPLEEDASVKAFSALAQELGIYLHIGSLALDAGDNKIANRAVLFGADGSILALYDKIHLFDVDLANGESWRESAVYDAGEEAVIADLTIGPIGLTICYDVRFPKLYRALAHAGALVLTAPAAFTAQTGEAHWHVLQRARAIENGAFMVSAAQGGHHDDGRQTYGHSIIVDPWGRVLAEAQDDTPQIISADIDVDEANQARAKIPALKNERSFRLDEAEGSTMLRSVS